MSARKDLKNLRRLAEDQGWTVELTRQSGHWRFTSPDGATYTTGSTPSDGRGLLNLTTDLRKLGLDIPRPGYTPPKRKRINATSRLY